MSYTLRKILLINILFLSSCVSQEKVYDDPNLIRCQHKYDSRIKILYNPENISRFTLNDVVMFRIIDVEKNVIFLNIYEIENYTCGNNGKIN